MGAAIQCFDGAQAHAPTAFRVRVHTHPHTPTHHLCSYFRPCFTPNPHLTTHCHCSSSQAFEAKVRQAALQAAKSDVAAASTAAKHSGKHSGKELGKLGIGLTDDNRVTAPGPCAEDGLRVWDLVLSVDGESVGGRTLAAFMADHPKHAQKRAELEAALKEAEDALASLTVE